MPNALYRVPYDDQNRPDPIKFPAIAGDVGRIAGDGATASIAGGACEVYIEWKSFRALYPELAKHVAKKNMFAEIDRLWGLPALKTERKRVINEAREEVRAVPPVADLSPGAAIGLTAAGTAAAGLASLSGGPGFCLGATHDAKSPKELLYDGLDQDTMFGAPAAMPPRVMFIEEIPKELQGELTGWLEDGDNASDMPPALKQYVTAQNRDLPPPKNWTGILQKAKEKGVKVFGINSTAATPASPQGHPSWYEERIAMMNAVAKEVIEAAKLQFPGAKMVAHVGAAHMNTHYTGMPGVAEMMGVPAVTAEEGTGKLTAVPDPSRGKGMPSKAEYAFIDRYLDQLYAASAEDMKKLGSPETIVAFSTDMFEHARSVAASLTAAGTLTDEGSVDAALDVDTVKAQQKKYAELVKAWPSRARNPDQTAQLAISAGSTAMLRKMVVDERLPVLNKADSSGNTLMHVAALKGRADIITFLAGQGERLDVPNRAGNLPIHMAVAERNDGAHPAAHAQSEGVAALLAAGANVNAVGQEGKTAMHVAAKNGNPTVMEALHTGGASLTVTDDRGWTPYDATVASTKVAAEKWFYSKGQINPPKVSPLDADLDTVQALLNSTKFEDAAKHRPLVEAALKELYGNPDMRPVMDLLARDALMPRDPDNGTGLRLVVAKGDACGRLFHPSKIGSAGAYDEGAHVLMVAGDGSRDLAGEFAHEMTHAAARLAFKNADALPYETPEQKAEYLKAIAGDVRLMSLTANTGEEADIKERISTRMATTVRDYPDDAEEKLMQEFAVSVPQLIAEHGSAEVEKLAPGLSKYFKTTFTDACKARASDPKYRGVSGKLDNQNLTQTAVPRPPRAPTWIANGTSKTEKTTAINSVVGMVSSSYRVMNGRANKLPSGVSTPYLTTQYTLPPEQEKAFLANMQVAEKAMRKALLEEGLPPAMAADEMRALALTMHEDIKTAPSKKALAELAAARATSWARESKLAYVAHCDATNTPPDLDVLAEAIVIKAEKMAWEESKDRTTLERYPAIEVNAKKHKEMVAKLAQDLRTQGLQPNQLAGLVDRLAPVLAGDKTSGFYRKTDKKGRTSEDHVSVSKTDARRVWLQELRQV